MISNFYQKYFLLFKSLDLSSIQNKNHGTGRTGYSRHAMIWAFIVKHLLYSNSATKYFSSP